MFRVTEGAYIYSDGKHNFVVKIIYPRGSGRGRKPKEDSSADRVRTLYCPNLKIAMDCIFEAVLKRDHRLVFNPKTPEPLSEKKFRDRIDKKDRSLAKFLQVIRKYKEEIINSVSELDKSMLEPPEEIKSRKGRGRKRKENVNI